MDEPVDYKAYPILYVDDEPLALETLQRQFRREFTILTASSAAQGLEILRERTVALVLADQRMPDTTGTQLLSRVRVEFPHAVRMLLTAYTDLESVVEAINQGHVYRYLTKPYDEREVRMALREGIERYALVQERDRLYAANVETMKRVARANRLSAVGTMAAALAHEINNPLVPISTFLQMLPAKRDESTRDPEYWDVLYPMTLKEVERIRKLIHELLTYAKFTGETEPTFEAVDLNALLEELATFLASQVRSRGATLTMTPDPSLPRVWIDAERIKQVLTNLLLNATQAMPAAGGAITVTTRTTTVQGVAHAEITVTDTGIGIPQEHREKLFTPFFTTKGGDGNGLGLLTCQHVIDEHRGTIDVDSEVGKGTTFRIKLPVDPRAYERRRTVGWWDDGLPAAA
jgi:signal transduction histidine kinase